MFFPCNGNTKAQRESAAWTGVTVGSPDTSIFIYRGSCNHQLPMFLIIRCPGCRTFSYVDRFQQWKLCPVCGEAIEVAKAPAYIEVDEYRVAERIVSQLEDYLHRNRKKDLSPEELAALREQYAEWLRSKA